MLRRVLCLTLLSTAVVNNVRANIFENFESYNNDAELHAVWVPTGAPAQNVLLFDFNSPGQPYTDITPPDPGSVDGKAVLFDGTNGGVARYAPTFLMNPSATHNVVLKADLAHDMQNSNKRLTVGLRNSNTQNILEMGFYNGLPQGPNGEFFQFGYRLANVPGSGFTTENNGWYKFSLPQNKDQLFEIGQKAFHTFEATISLTGITFKVDLFGDNINNGTGEPGVWDAIDFNPGIVQASGFNDLRFGGPSGITSGSPFLGIDNISLQLVPVPSGDNPDFDGDGDWDGRDFLIWQRGFGRNDFLNAEEFQKNGDADGDLDIDEDDLAIWQDWYVNGPPQPVSSLGSVPEPTSAVLLLIAVASLGTSRRR